MYKAASLPGSTRQSIFLRRKMDRGQARGVAQKGFLNLQHNNIKLPFRPTCSDFDKFFAKT
jgi:hypothetical protein